MIIVDGAAIEAGAVPVLLGPGAVVVTPSRSRAAKPAAREPS
jgi:hypothetical protein